MHTLLACVNCKPTKAGVSFTWEGAWEYDRMQLWANVYPVRNPTLC